MQFLFLGYSVKKIMELNLDVKDITILRYFDDFRKSGKMNFEVVSGVKHYWVSYQNIENELPFLGLSKRTIMMRMLRMRDLGILTHYTKKECGTFSFYGLGERYNELIYVSENKVKNNVTKIKEEIKEVMKEEVKEKNKEINCSLKGNLKSEDSNSKIDEGINNIIKIEEVKIYEKIDNKVNNDKFSKNEESILKDRLGESYLEEGRYNNEETLSFKMKRGYSSECLTKTHLLNNSSTILNNIYNNLKGNVKTILDYLSLKVGVRYKESNSKTINLIKDRLKEGFVINDFKVVIDNKVRSWTGTKFEQYLTPFTLFGDKFEVYLNQKVIKLEEKNYFGQEKLRFQNFEGRDYDYDKLEKQLLGWA